jgi:hypothetical protein
MRLVHPHLAELMIEGVKDGDFVRPLEHLLSTVYRNEGHAFGPTLVARGRKALTGQRNLAELLQDFRRPELQDRIGVIADQLVAIADARSPVRTRVLFRTGPGPDSGGSKALSALLLQVPEKSGIEAVLCAVLIAGPTAGATTCPKAGGMEIADTIANERKSRCRLCMVVLPSWFVD